MGFGKCNVRNVNEVYRIIQISTSYETPIQLATTPAWTGDVGRNGNQTGPDAYTTHAESCVSYGTLARTPCDLATRLKLAHPVPRTVRSNYNLPSYSLLVFVAFEELPFLRAVVEERKQNTIYSRRSCRTEQNGGTTFRSASRTP